MAGVVTSLSRVTIIAYITVFALVDLILLLSRKKDTLNNIFNTMQSVLIVMFLANSGIVLYLNTGEGRIIILVLAQLLLLGFSNFIYSLLFKSTSRALQNNMYMLLSISLIVLARLDFDKAIRQFIFAVAAFIFCIIIIEILLKAEWIKRIPWVYCALGILMLLSVLTMASYEYGAKLSIEIFTISLQPAEFVKLSIIFFLATVIIRYQDLKGFLFAAVGTAIHVLILVASRDLGAALIYIVIFMLVTFIAYRNYLFLGLELLAGVGCSMIAYRLFSHVQTRVLAWQDPLSVVDNEGYQIAQSLFAIGTGGWLGSGLCQGMPTKIPVVTKDFIFSAISEELGGITALALIVMFMCTFVFIFQSAINARDDFYMLINSGIASAFAMQTILNIGGVTKFIPSTGVTLPFISYGGSSLVSMFIAISIVLASDDLSIQRERPEGRRRSGHRRRDRYEEYDDYEDDYRDDPYDDGHYEDYEDDYYDDYDDEDDYIPPKDVLKRGYRVDVEDL